MRKSLLPMIASLALCGSAALIVPAGAAPVMLAQAAPTDRTDAVPPPNLPDRTVDRAARRAQFCNDRYARRIGELAFLEAKLSLSADQAPLFARWKQVKLDTARQHEGACASHERRGQRANAVDRLARQEDRLNRRLADIQAERPALAAFYAVLTPEQQDAFGRGGERHKGRMHMMGMERPHRGMDRGPRNDAPPAQ